METKKNVNVINFLAVLLWAATAASTLLPFKKARDLSDPAHVLTFFGRSLYEVSPFWGVATGLSAVLFIWLLLSCLPSREKILLSFPLSTYQVTALPAVMVDFRVWESSYNMNLFTGYELGWVLYVVLSAVALVSTFVSLHRQLQVKADMQFQPALP